MRSVRASCVLLLALVALNVLSHILPTKSMLPARD
jgi:hypothetical protein